MSNTLSTADAAAQSANADPDEVFDREFLTVRSRVLDVAAALDRLDRAAAPGSAASALVDDPRWATLRKAIEALQADGPGRAERVQLLFSLPYDEDWREQFGLTGEPTSAG